MLLNSFLSFLWYNYIGDFVKEKIYFITAIETIVNHKKETRLKNYRLEYFLDIQNYTITFLEGFDAALVLGVKIINNKTNEIEWANLFYKILAKNKSAVDINSEETIRKILSSPLEEQLQFISRPETVILKKPYATTDFIEPSEFTNELKKSSYDDYPIITLGGKLSKEIRQETEELFDNIMAMINEKTTKLKKSK